MIAYVAGWSEQKDGLAANTRILVPDLAKHCAVQVVTAKIGDRSSAYVDHLTRGVQDAELVHIEHNFAYFNYYWPFDVHTAVMSKIRAPIVLNVNEVPEWNRKFWPVRRALRNLLMVNTGRRVFPRASRLLVYTKHQISQLERLGVPRAIMEWLPHFVTSPVRSAASEAAAWRQEHGYSVADRLLVIFGFINPRKEIELAMEALSGMPEDVNLVLAGDVAFEGDRYYLEQLKLTAARLGVSGRFRVTGFVSERELPCVFAAADLVLFPSSHAYSSGSLHKAISFRRPILAAQTPTVSEILEFDRCVETFPPGDSESLRAATLALLKDCPRQRELVRATERYAQRFSPEDRVRRFVEIYSELLGHPPSGEPALLVDGE